MSSATVSNEHSGLKQHAGNGNIPTKVKVVPTGAAVGAEIKGVD